MGLIVFIAFWVFAIRAWCYSGIKVPFVCVALWAGALFGFPILGINGFWFLLVEVILTIYLYLYVKFEEAGI